MPFQVLVPIEPRAGTLLKASQVAQNDRQFGASLANRINEFQSSQHESARQFDIQVGERKREFNATHALDMARTASEIKNTQDRLELLKDKYNILRPALQTGTQLDSQRAIGELAMLPTVQSATLAQAQADQLEASNLLTLLNSDAARDELAYKIENKRFQVKTGREQIQAIQRLRDDPAYQSAYQRGITAATPKDRAEAIGQMHAYATQTGNAAAFQNPWWNEQIGSIQKLGDIDTEAQSRAYNQGLQDLNLSEKAITHALNEAKVGGELGLKNLKRIGEINAQILHHKIESGQTEKALQQIAEFHDRLTNAKAKTGALNAETENTIAVIEHDLENYRREANIVQRKQIRERVQDETASANETAKLNKERIQAARAQVALENTIASGRLSEEQIKKQIRNTPEEFRPLYEKLYAVVKKQNTYRRLDTEWDLSPSGMPLWKRILAPGPAIERTGVRYLAHIWRSWQSDQLQAEQDILLDQLTELKEQPAAVVLAEMVHNTDEQKKDENSRLKSENATLKAQRDAAVTAAAQ